MIPDELKTSVTGNSYVITSREHKNKTLPEWHNLWLQQRAISASGIYGLVLMKIDTDNHLYIWGYIHFDPHWRCLDKNGLTKQTWQLFGMTWLRDLHITRISRFTNHLPSVLVITATRNGHLGVAAAAIVVCGVWLPRYILSYSHPPLSIPISLLSEPILETAVLSLLGKMLKTHLSMKA